VIIIRGRRRRRMLGLRCKKDMQGGNADNDDNERGEEE
jgi:hypothetical protein